MSPDVLLIVIGLVQMPWFLNVAFHLAPSRSSQSARAIGVITLLATAVGILVVAAGRSIRWELLGLVLLAVMASTSMIVFLRSLNPHPRKSGPFRDFLTRAVILLALPIGIVWFPLLKLPKSLAPDVPSVVVVALGLYTLFFVPWTMTTYRAVMEVRFSLLTKGRDFSFGAVLLAVSLTTLGIIARSLKALEAPAVWLPGAQESLSLIISLALWLSAGILLLLMARLKHAELLQIGLIAATSATWLLAWLLIRRGLLLRAPFQWNLLLIVAPLFFAVLLFESMFANFVKIQHRHPYRPWFVPAALHASLAGSFAFVTLWLVSQPLGAPRAWPWGIVLWLIIAAYVVYSAGAGALSHLARSYAGAPDFSENSATFNSLHDATYYWAGWVFGILIPAGSRQYLAASTSPRGYWWWLVPLGALGVATFASLPMVCYADENIQSHIDGLKNSMFSDTPDGLRDLIQPSIDSHLRTQLAGVAILLLLGWIVLIPSTILG